MSRFGNLFRDSRDGATKRRRPLLMPNFAAIVRAVLRGALLGGAIALAVLTVGCINDDSPKPVIATPDASIDLPVVDSGAPPPPPVDAGASADGAVSVTATVSGSVVSKSEHYRLVTRTGGSPGSGVGASTSFKTKPPVAGAGSAKP